MAVAGDQGKHTTIKKGSSTMDGDEAAGTTRGRVTPVKGVPPTESFSLEKKSAQDVHIASRDMRYEI